MQASAFTLGLGLAFVIAALSVLARRLRLPAPMIMLVAGVAVSLVPGLPTPVLDPDLVLLLLLPPLLYSSGVGMSWRGFRDNLRAILLLAVGCVLFTAGAVALVVHFVFGVPWAVGFVLGAIVSPPDAVAPMAIARRLGLPRRLLLVLEGESLVNDATALVAFSFALAAVATGHFSFGEATLRFVVNVVGELAFGVGVGWIMLRLRHLAADPRAETLLAFATPFVAFWPPHEAGGSGVIACVAAGLFVSWNGRLLIRSPTRLQGFFIWNLITWVIEALVFLLTGLQAHGIFASLTGDGAQRLVAAGALVSLTVIVVRFIWVYPATYLPRILIPGLSQRDPSPDWRTPFLIGFTGLRGVVSLAAALSVPIAIGGEPFPERDLILFATFSVILVTLVGQGAMLPRVIRWLELGRAGSSEAAVDKHNEHTARIEGVNAVLGALEAAAADGMPSAVSSLRRHYAERRAQLTSTADETTPDNPVADTGLLQLRMVGVEREAIGRVFVDNRLSDEARRRIERELDLEEARILHELKSVGAPGIAADD